MGKLLESDGGSLEGERRHGGFRPLPFLLFAKGIEVRYVGNIVLGNVGHLAPGETHCLSHALPDGFQRLTFHRPPLLKIGQRGRAVLRLLVVLYRWLVHARGLARLLR